MENDQEIILPDSPKAATYVKLEGWMSRNKRIFGKDKEAEARVDGATHAICKCGAVSEMYRFACSMCIEARKLKHRKATHAKMPKQPPRWSKPEYFWSMLLQEYLDCDEIDDHEKSRDELLLTHCKSEELHIIESDVMIGEFWEEPPNGLQELIDTFNEGLSKIQNNQIIGIDVAVDWGENDKS